MKGTSLATAKLLIVDDDIAVRTLVRKALSVEDVEFVDAENAAEALEQVRTANPDVIVLDIGLPGRSGLEVLVEIRKNSETPVLLLTGRADEADRIAGLDLGADDYVVKPFYPGELAARVRSLMRRTKANRTSTIDVGGLFIDRSVREIEAAGAPILLTAKEFDLLAFLARSPRQVFTREQLLRHVWESSSEWQDPATVTEHIRRIRNKLDETECTAHIATVRGVGYRFEPGTSEA